MNRIASPQDLQAEIRRLLAYSQSPKPSREKLASELQALAGRVAATPKMIGNRPEQVAEWLATNILKVGQDVKIWVGRGKDDYHEGTVAAVKLWPRPGDAAFPRDGLQGLTTREDDYVVKSNREAAYEGEPGHVDLTIRGMRGGQLFVSCQRQRVYKLALM